jgi:hypothetical protein
MGRTGVTNLKVILRWPKFVKRQIKNNLTSQRGLPAFYCVGDMALKVVSSGSGMLW